MHLFNWCARAPFYRTLLSVEGIRDVQACTIGLSINKNLKLEKGKEKKSSAGQSRVLLYGPQVT
jgi:hypothetical protein